LPQQTAEAESQVNEASLDDGRLRRAVEALTPSLAWLSDTRRRAFETFCAHGFPTTSEEDWRYTDLRTTAELTDTLAGRPAEASTSLLDARLLQQLVPGNIGTMAVFTGGLFRPELSRLSHAPGLDIQPLTQIGPTARQQLASRIASTACGAAGPLVSLNAALIKDGLSIEVAPGAVISEPIYVVFGSVIESATHNRLLIRLGAGSKATVIEHHVSMATSVSNTMSDVICEPTSRFSYLKLQDECDSAVHLAYQQIAVGEGASAELLHLDFGARLARNDLRVELSGRKSAVTAHGLFFADLARQLDNHTRIDHKAPDTVSRELYRGIADGHGRGVFNGKVIVHVGASKTDAQLTSQNLLLSRTAEIDTKPELEIYADDVKCSHGATTGQLDANAVFYLRSRGIPFDDARRMLIASFARQIVKRVPSEALDDHVVRLLRDRLPAMREVSERP
jgi:Fe-S cluster assembly protein SufD